MTSCTHCDKPAIINYTVCQYHREYCRAMWESRAADSKEAGLCAYCDKEAANGTLRCKDHTIYNKKICKIWNKVPSNKEHKAQYDKNKKTTWRSIGRCHNCEEHNKLTPPFVKCEPCRLRHRARDKKRRSK